MMYCEVDASVKDISKLGCVWIWGRFGWGQREALLLLNTCISHVLFWVVVCPCLYDS